MLLTATAVVGGADLHGADADHGAKAAIERHDGSSSSGQVSWAAICSASGAGTPRRASAKGRGVDGCTGALLMSGRELARVLDQRGRNSRGGRRRGLRRGRYGRCGRGLCDLGAGRLLGGRLSRGFVRGVGEEGAAEEGQRRPPGDEDAQPVGNIAQVQEPGRGDVGAEGGGQGDEEPAPARRPVAARAKPTPSSHEQQVDRDRVGPGFPTVLPGGRGQVVQVGEGQRSSDDGLDEHGIDAGEVGAHGWHLLSVSAWEG